MSSYAYVEFYSKKTGKKVTERIINQLKYAIDNVEPNCSIKVNEDAGKELYKNYIGFIPKEINIPKEDILEIKGNEITFEKDLSLYDKYKELKVEINFKDYTENKEKYYDEYFEVSGWKLQKYHGNWYNADAFVTARDISETKIKESLEKIFKLKQIENSAEYYKLTSEQKSDFIEDIEYLEDTIKEEQSKAYAYQYMINLLDDFIKDEYDLGWEDTVYAYIYIA